MAALYSCSFASVGIRFFTLTRTSILWLAFLHTLLTWWLKFSLLSIVTLKRFSFSVDSVSLPWILMIISYSTSVTFFGCKMIHYRLYMYLPGSVFSLEEWAGKFLAFIKRSLAWFFYGVICFLFCFVEGQKEDSGRFTKFRYPGDKKVTFASKLPRLHPETPVEDWLQRDFQVTFLKELHTSSRISFSG